MHVFQAIYVNRAPTTEADGLPRRQHLVCQHLSLAARRPRAREMDDRCSKVYEIDARIARRPRLDAGTGQHQRDVHGWLVRHDLAPEFVVAEHFAVVRGVDHDGVVEDVPIGQVLEIATQVRVDVFDHGRVVGPDGVVLLRIVLVRGDRRRQVGIEPARLHRRSHVHRLVGTVEVHLQEPGRVV